MAKDDRKPENAALISGLILFGMIALVASSTLPLFEGVLSCITALIVTRCTTLERMLKAVKLPTVLTIVGAFGLGVTIRVESIAEVLADILIFLLAPFGARGLLCAICAATVALGVVFHGTAVVALMFPICKEAADKMGLPIHQVIAVLMIAVTGQFLSPISYQTNLMAYGAGGYEFADFTKTGSGLVVLLSLTGIISCEYAFPTPVTNGTTLLS